MAEEIHGIVEELLICTDPATILSTAVESVEVTFEGFVGDKHSGWTKPSDGRTKYYMRGTEIRNTRQVSIVSLEEMEEIARDVEVEILRPEWIGANLMISGIQGLTQTKINSRMFFSSGAVLLITNDNLPCSTMTDEIMNHIPGRPDLKNKIIPASMSKRGLVAVVELPGRIQKGDEVRVVIAR